MSGLFFGVIVFPGLVFSSGPKDGELTFPKDYKSFPVFLKDIQKKNAVRDLYINNKGAAAHKGETFPDGTQLVMAIFKVKAGADGNPVKGSDGKLVKDKLAKVYLMEKSGGWGVNAPTNLKNGDWIFSAFSADGKRIEVDYTKCRSCHLPFGASKDFVHRYDEYFSKKMGAH
jgi:hypothetical protein